MTIQNDLLDQLLSDYKKPEDIIGENALLKQLTKALVERALEVEMTSHLGYSKRDPAGRNKKNSRNGKSVKTSKGISAPLTSGFHATGTGLSPRRFSPRASGGSLGSMTRSSRCTPVA